MAEESGTSKERSKSPTNRSSWTDSLLKQPAEKKSVLRKKSLVAVPEPEDNYHQRATIECSDMTQEMQAFIVNCAVEAITRDKFNTEQEIASHIRREMEERYDPTWHCIVGRTFGSYVSHESKHYIYLSVGNIGIIVFKSG